MTIFEKTLAFAKAQDLQDECAVFRQEFYLPTENGKPLIYFCGNSLGLQPVQTQRFINEELEDWKNFGVEGHFRSRRAWFSYHHLLKEKTARLVGAKPLEVTVMNNLSANLHFLMVSFYRPEGKKTKILMESGAFPSDQYIVETQVRWHKLDPAQNIAEIAPRIGETNLRTEDILAKIEELGEELALVFFSGVNYYTGQLFDIEAITKTAHKVGAKAGFDLAHTAGNVPLALHDWNADFAAWCSYKYLNSSPGGVSGVFVHERHAKTDQPRLAGWWGHNEKERFLMKKGFEPMEGADGWQLSNAPILGMAAHLASLEIFDRIGMAALRKKSLKLTGFLEFLIQEIQSQGFDIQIITPNDPAQRGAQLSIVVKPEGRKIFDLLTKNGVVADWREPDVIRVAPAPLYNTFEEVFSFYEILLESFEK